MKAAPIYRGEIPYLSTEQMIEVDRTMIEDFGIELVQMMENAGRALAHLARARFLAGDSIDRHVTIMPVRGATAVVRWCVPGGCTAGVRRSRYSSPNPREASLRSPPISYAFSARCT
jgi:hypothetical protein